MAEGGGEAPVLQAEGEGVEESVKGALEVSGGTGRGREGQPQSAKDKAYDVPCILTNPSQGYVHSSRIGYLEPVS